VTRPLPDDMVETAGNSVSFAISLLGSDVARNKCATTSLTNLSTSFLRWPLSTRTEPAKTSQRRRICRQTSLRCRSGNSLQAYNRSWEPVIAAQSGDLGPGAGVCAWDGRPNPTDSGAESEKNLIGK
jgi:hypothetical protein